MRLAVAATALIGGLLVVAGALAQGAPAAYGAALGSTLTLLVFTLGTVVVGLVAGLMPRAALLVALLTYTLQVLAMGLVFVALTRSGALDHSLRRGWISAAVIATTACWLVVQVRVATRQRIPVFDLPPAAAPTPAENATHGKTRGER